MSGTEKKDVSIHAIGSWNLHQENRTGDEDSRDLASMFLLVPHSIE